MASRRDITGRSGKPIVWRIDELHRLGDDGTTKVYLDVTVANTALIVTAKRNRADTDGNAVWRGGNGIGAATGLSGVQPHGASDTNRVNVNMPGVNTAAFDRTELLEWELTIVEPSGREDVWAYGTLKVSRSVSPAPA